MISAGPFPEPLLKRPFCHFSGNGTIDLLYRLRGKGTRLLSAMKPGADVDVLGPLGNAWPELPKGKAPVVIAGGTGIASVFPLIKSLGRKATVIYGARCGEEVLYKDELLSMSAELHLATDDGTCGIKGTVGDVLNGFFTISPSQYLYVCGPEIMTRAVAEEAKVRGAKGAASLEAFMAWGIGACMGCAVRTTSGYKRVCREGPVFNLHELVFA
jgi:dihydroorotate dehydrogenase electron transfer subunit